MTLSQPNRQLGTVVVRKLTKKDFTAETVMVECTDHSIFLAINDGYQPVNGTVSQQQTQNVTAADQARFRCGCLVVCISCSGQFRMLGFEYCIYHCARRWMSQVDESESADCSAESASTDWSGGRRFGSSGSLEVSVEVSPPRRHNRIRKRGMTTFSKRLRSRLRRQRPKYQRPILS